ncbi:protein kinase [Myxococcota bacterium]|nr:protein kinase [Myxococcota bacterium]MBU1411784.1 protein kinase [Myxococcota bacterium]MBU1508987.1 protein kinase [Myxococcota bacterium]
MNQPPPSTDLDQLGTPVSGDPEVQESGRQESGRNESGRPISGPFPEVSGDATPVEITTPVPQMHRIALPGPENEPVDVDAHTHLGMPVTPPPVSVPSDRGPSSPRIPTLDSGSMFPAAKAPESRERPTRELAMPSAGDQNQDSNEVATSVLHKKFSNTMSEEGPLSGVLFEGKYKVGSLLGEGGMGQVYKATHIMMRKDVALKILHPTMGLRPEIVERFRREAESAARLSHPNIIQVLDFGRASDSTFYLVMEFVEGSSLSHVMYEGPMNWRRVCRMGIQMLSALEEAHKAGVVHRDLKPDNIMLQIDAGGEEHLKILDFGIAKLAESEGGVQVTQAGMIFGTPSYISPEQAQGRIVTHKADLYAMGVILFQMLTQRLPFEASSPIDLLGKHIHEPPPRVRSYVPDIPAPLEALILKTMSKKPDDRPQDAFEMRSVLGKLLEMDHYRNTMSVPIRARMDDFFTSRAGKVVIGLLAVFALAGILYFVATSLTSADSQKTVSVIPDDGTEPPSKVDPSGPDAKNGGPKSAAMILLESKKLEEALKTAENALTANPGDEIAVGELKQIRKVIVAEGKKTFSDEMIGLSDTRALEEKFIQLRRWIEWFPQDGELQFLHALSYARVKDFRKSIDVMSKALLLDPELKKHKAVPTYINRNLLQGSHWIRQNTLKLIKENFGQDKAEDVKFLLTTLNDEKFDADDRYELYQFLKFRGVSEGILEESFWTAQLRWSTTCRNRIAAATWFSQNGHRGHVDFLKSEVAKKYFNLGSGKTQSSSCYKTQLQAAIAACSRRKPAP